MNEAFHVAMQKTKTKKNPEIPRMRLHKQALRRRRDPGWLSITFRYEKYLLTSASLLHIVE